MVDEMDESWERLEIGIERRALQFAVEVAEELLYGDPNLTGMELLDRLRERANRTA